MALGFILLLKNNHFKHIQRWKPTQVLLLCVKQMKTDELRVQSKEMKFLCHTALGDPALHSSSSPAWDSPFLSRERNQAQPWCSADQGSHLQLAIQKQIHDEFRGFSSFFCWQSSAGSWTSAAELSLTPEISAWNWVLLPHSYKCSCLKGNLATAESTESLQMLQFWWVRAELLSTANSKPFL